MTPAVVALAILLFAIVALAVETLLAPRIGRNAARGAALVSAAITAFALLAGAPGP